MAFKAHLPLSKLLRRFFSVLSRNRRWWYFGLHQRSLQLRLPISHRGGNGPLNRGSDVDGGDVTDLADRLFQHLLRHYVSCYFWKSSLLLSPLLKYQCAPKSNLLLSPLRKYQCAPKSNYVLHIWKPARLRQVFDGGKASLTLMLINSSSSNCKPSSKLARMHSVAVNKAAAFWLLLLMV